MNNIILPNEMWQKICDVAMPPNILSILNQLMKDYHDTDYQHVIWKLTHFYKQCAMVTSNDSWEYNYCDVCEAECHECHLLLNKKEMILLRTLKDVHIQWNKLDDNNIYIIDYITPEIGNIIELYACNNDEDCINSAKEKINAIDAIISNLDNK